MALINNTLLAVLLSTATLVIGIVAMQIFSRKNHFPLDDRTAIVTGGSQGLGLSVAKLLASRGANVVIVAQDVAKLESAVTEIRSSAKSQSRQRFSHLSFDLRDPASAPAILDNVTRWNNGTAPSILFHCAGHCIPGFFASTSLETLRGQMDTLYWSAAYLAHATLNLWLKSDSMPSLSNKPSPNMTKPTSRHIIFTSSALAFFPVAGYAPYSPAKAAMKSLADTLNQELAMYNGARTKSPGASAADIKVHTLYPMGIFTPGYENENKLKPALTMLLEENDKPQHPDEVARITIERLEKGEQHITTMLVGHLLKGFGIGSSVRSGVMDVLWNMLGSIIILFVGPDLVKQCRKWGQENGIEAR